jgi:hypothetical protein
MWHTRIDGIVRAFGSGFEGMITGAKTFQQAMVGVGQAILGAFTNVAERMLENWIVSLLASKAQQGLTGVAQVASNAAVAGSAAFASTAAIPLIGPELAPAAALAAYAGAMAFAPLASAFGGYDIPAGANPLVQTHAEEMILPARIANPLRSMLAANSNIGSSAAGPANDTGSGGVTHNHHYNISAVDGVSVERMLHTHSRTFEKAAQRAVRNLRAPA